MKPSVQITPITRRALVSGAIAAVALSAMPATTLAHDEGVGRMKFGPEVRYIPQWQDFYVRHPELVAWEKARPRFGPRDWRRMETIVRRQDHPYRPDGSHDVWRLLGPGEAGDCEDMALTLMRDLVADGFELGCIRPLISFPRCDAHMTLRVTTEEGDFVILCQRKLIVRWNELDWDWHSCHSVGSDWPLYNRKVT
jgi:predicted transglutaminase-like cysteine proteinase